MEHEEPEHPEHPPPREVGASAVLHPEEERQGDETNFSVFPD